jgi:hypothetical protein
MKTPRRTRRPGSRSTGARLALLGYIGAWLAGAAAIAGLTLLILDSGDRDEVSLPPVRETKLVRAAREAGCELRRAAPGEALNPPVDGAAAATPAPADYYETAPDVPSLIAAMRRGVIVIHVLRPPDDAEGELLRDLQEAVPDGTIVTPNSTRMPFEIAVTAYRRLLGCRDFNSGAVDAVQLFRGRYVGSGPGS